MVGAAVLSTASAAAAPVPLNKDRSAKNTRNVGKTLPVAVLKTKAPKQLVMTEVKPC